MARRTGWLSELRAAIQKHHPEQGSKPDPIEWAEAASGVKLDPWQRDLMTSTASRELLLCSRQVGKSFAVAIRAGYEVAFTPGASIAVIAPSQRQSINLADSIRSALMQSPLRLEFKSLSRTEIVVEGGGRLLALPGDSPDRVRGLTLSRCIIDEGAYVRDTLMPVLMPMLSVTKGALTILSTPSGPAGLFYDSWSGSGSWDRIKVLATSCPRISSAFLAEALTKLGPLLYSQEYECQFVQNQGAFFNAARLDAAFSNVLGNDDPPDTPSRIDLAFSQVLNT